MGVIQTNEWLREFVKKQKDTSNKFYLELQREILCEPIANYFEEFNSFQLHKYFLENGLFHPDAKILTEIKKLEKKNVWNFLQKYYQILKKAWDGPKVATFIFPVEKRNDVIMKDLKGKMGVSFHNVIILFITSELSTKDLQALFTHEYNHICRLAVLKKNFDELTLLDSMLIEGMAEVAVEKTIGKRALAPWISLYSKKELLPHWGRVIQFMELKGKEKHDAILYGDDSRRGFPKWFGYSLGYHIVSSFIERNKDLTIKELLRIGSKEILAQSDFAVNNNKNRKTW